MKREERMPFVLDSAEPGALGLRADRLDGLCAIIEGHINEGRYPGAQIAVARHGKLALYRSFGAARLEPQPAPARDDTPLAALFQHQGDHRGGDLDAGRGRRCSPSATAIAEHLPEFARNGKGDITVLQVLTHQAGFPSAAVSLPPGSVGGSSAVASGWSATSRSNGRPGSRLAVSPASRRIGSRRC